MARALIINPDVKERAGHVKAYAETHIATVEMMQQRIAGKLAPVGDDDCHCLLIENGFRVVYSQEEQLFKRNGRKGFERYICHHISISVDGGKYPHELAVAEICNLFGADWEKRIAVFLEEDCRAVNVVIPLKDP